MAKRASEGYKSVNSINLKYGADLNAPRCLGMVLKALLETSARRVLQGWNGVSVWELLDLAKFNFFLIYNEDLFNTNLLCS